MPDDPRYHVDSWGVVHLNNPPDYGNTAAHDPGWEWEQRQKALRASRSHEDESLPSEPCVSPLPPLANSTDVHTPDDATGRRLLARWRRHR